MKKFIIVFVALLPLISYSQVGTTKECTSCINNKVDLLKGASALGTANNSEGINSFAVGYSNIASGDYSMALGNDVLASGENSIAMGYKSQAVGDVSVSIGLHAYTTTNALMSLAIGSRVTSSVEKAMTMGNGLYENPITNNIENSLMIGFNSNLHTFFVSESSGQNTTGKIGIGNLTNPQAKLHIRADDNEYASLFLEPTNSNKFGKLMLGDVHTYIQAKPSDNLKFYTSAGKSFIFNTGNVGIGTNSPSALLDVSGTMEVNGDATFTQDLTVSGESHLNGITLNDDTNITGVDKIIGFNDLRLLGSEGSVDLFIGSNGNIGIGTVDPMTKVDVLQNVPNVYAMRLKHDNNSGGNGLLITSNSGDADAVLMKIIRDLDGSPSDVLYVDGEANVVVGSIDHTATLDVKGSLNVSEDVTFEQNLTVSGNLNGVPYAPSMWNVAGDDISYETGKVGIGTNSVPDEYIFAINGKAIAEEIMIQHPDDWFDFVFYDDYQLPKLSEVESYVKKHNHLMDIPSEKQVQSEGIAIGEMNGLLLKKIEELTLYTIEQQKLIEQQQESFTEQQKEIDILKSQILKQ